MKFFIIAALLSFLLGSLAEVRVYSPSSFMKPSYHGINKLYQHAQNRTQAQPSLRTNSISGNVPGSYLAVTVYNSETCLGAGESHAIYKTGMCIPVFDDDTIAYNVRVGCFMDTGMTTSSFYDGGDTTCSGPQTIHTDAHSGVCGDGSPGSIGFQGYCFADHNFMRDAYQDTPAFLVYPDAQTAAGLRISDSFYGEIVYGSANAVWSLGKEDRKRCNKLIPGLDHCFDTRHVQSIAYVVTGLTTGQLNLYSKKYGGGSVTSFPYDVQVLPNVDNTATVYTYLSKKFYNAYM